MANKSGGDVSQLNFGTQGNATSQHVAGAASSGPAILDSVGGSSALSQYATQAVSQALEQANFGVGGNGGDDNIHADTNITVA